MNDYYVYEWYNVDTEEVFYVGKGKNNRYKQYKNRNKFFKDYYSTHNCCVRKVFENLSEDDAFTKEKELIRLYRETTNYRLTNQTDGGEGMSGFIITEDFRNKMREVVLGDKNPNYGHKWSEEQKEKARQRMLSVNYKGENNPNYGNKWNEAQRKRASDLRKNNPKYIKENHGRAKEWIVLETGAKFILKENIKKYIKSLPKIPNGYHFVEYKEELDNLPSRLKLIAEIFNTSSFKIFIRDDGKILYGKKWVAKDACIDIKKLRKILSDKHLIEINNHTYYEINHSPFIQ